MITITDFDQAVGHRLATAREALQMSQSDLAACSGVPQATIHRIEGGERTASTVELSMLADACGVLVGDLRGEAPITGQVQCAGGVRDAGTQDLVNYGLYALGLGQRLDEHGVVVD